MLNQFAVGAVVSLCNIVIHALVMTIVIKSARNTSMRAPHALMLLPSVMVATVAVLMAAHACEVFVWAAAYHLVSATPPGTDLVYFAFVNYTTLGYGDVTPVPEWRLLGPITAMDGVLLFGWSTAVMFEVLRRTLALASGADPARG